MDIVKTIYGTSFELGVDGAANDSDKTFAVDSGENWELHSIWVQLATTSAAGNRQLRVDFIAPTLIDAQDETSYDNSPATEGTFAGGTGYAVSDVITLSDGSTITVDAVSSGVVTQFTVGAVAPWPTDSGATLSQISVVDSGGDAAAGTGFTLTPETSNLGNVFLSLLAGVTQAASLTYTYTIARGLPHLTSVIGTHASTPLPDGLVLPPKWQIRIYDSAAIAATTDDMTVRIWRNRIKSSLADITPTSP